MLNLLKLAITPLVELGKGWMENRRVKQEGKQRIEEAKINATVKRIENNDSYDARLEEISLQNRGWKDEYLLLITTAPIVLVFFPSMVPVIQAGFAALAELPEWYMWVMLMVFIDTFGFRRALRAWLDSKIGNNPLK